MYGLICVCCSCNLFSLLIYVLQKIQRAELFSKFSIPQDTQFISTILGENELNFVCGNFCTDGIRVVELGSA